MASLKADAARMVGAESGFCQAHQPKKGFIVCNFCCVLRISVGRNISSSGSEVKFVLEDFRKYL